MSDGRENADKMKMGIMAGPARSDTTGAPWRLGLVLVDIRCGLGEKKKQSANAYPQQAGSRILRTE